MSGSSPRLWVVATPIWSTRVLRRLYAALGALKLEAAGEVVIPPITDPGGAMPAALLCQVPVVADAAPGSFNAGAEQIEEVLTPPTRAIVVAHIAGEPADMTPILALAEERGIPIIEDCAQAHGARYKGQLAGSLGTVAAFSTMSGKHHATGPQGGVVFTRDEELCWEAKRFADRGKPFNTDATSNLRAGLNLNGNDLSAAIGRVQLKKLDAMIAKRRQVAAQIAEGIAECKAVRLGWQVGRVGGGVLVYALPRRCRQAPGGQKRLCPGSSRRGHSGDGHVSLYPFRGDLV